MTEYLKRALDNKVFIKTPELEKLFPVLIPCSDEEAMALLGKQAAVEDTPAAPGTPAAAAIAPVEDTPAAGEEAPPAARKGGRPPLNKDSY